MHDKLTQGDHFPAIHLDLIDGSKMVLPEKAPSLYVALLFYRGEW